MRHAPAAAAVLIAMLALAGCSAATTGTATPAAATLAAPTPVVVTSTGNVIDDAYLTTLAKRGVGTNDSERELRRAHAVCELLRTGTTFHNVVMALRANGFSAGDGGFVIGAAVTAYCPDQSGKVQA